MGNCESSFNGGIDMLRRSLMVICLCVLTLTGCSWLFGDGTPGSSGNFQKSKEAIDPIVKSLPFGTLISGALAAIGVIGTGIQTYRKKRDQFDATVLFNELKVDAIGMASDKDVEEWLKAKAVKYKLVAGAKKIYDKALAKEKKKAS